MTDNVVDFAQHIQKLKAKTEKPIALEEYSLDAKVLIMDPSLQLDMMLHHAAKLFIDGQLENRYIHTLLSMLKYVYEGVYPEFSLKTSVIPRQLPGEEGAAQWSIYSWGMNIDRMQQDGVPAPGFHPSYQLECTITKFDEGTVIDKGTIWPEDWMTFDISPEDCMTKRLPRHFIKKMNSLVSINGGQGILTQEGEYMTVIPWGGTTGVVLALKLENPITLIPVEERKKPE